MEIDAKHFDIVICPGGKNRNTAHRVEPTVNQEACKSAYDEGNDRVITETAAKDADRRENRCQEKQPDIRTDRCAGIDALVFSQRLYTNHINQCWKQCDKHDKVAT